MSAPDLAPDLAPDAPAADLEGDHADATGAALEHADPLTSLPPNLPPTGDPTMNEEEKQALALEAKQLEKSIAAAKAAGQTARAEALEARRQRVIARGIA